MPYPNEHSARVKDPADFDQDTFRRTNISDGVDIIVGKLSGKAGPDDPTETQAYRFDSSKFTAKQAKDWLDENDVDYISFEEASNDQVVEGHVFVYGEIIPWQDDNAREYGGVNLKDIVNQINQNNQANRLIVHVHSPGGSVSEGFAIHDALVNSGKEIVTIIEGLCASIATVVALAGGKRMMTENSEFLIHNPWTFAIGDSEDMKKQSEELRKTENKLAEFYAKKTNLDVDTLLAYMHEETMFSATEAQDYGFITEIVQTIKQVAFMKSTTKQLDAENSKKLGVLESMLQSIMNLLKPDKKALIVQDVDGNEIDFGEDVKSEDEISVGLKATVNGNAADGDYTLADGTVYKFESGELKEIVEPEKEEEETMEELKAENERLKTELEEAQSALTQAQENLTQVTTQVEKLNKDFKDFKGQFSTGNPDEFNSAAGDGKKTRKAFKSQDE